MNENNAVPGAQAGPPIPRKAPIANNKDWYWEVEDEDGDYDGYLHIVCTVDGSQLKIKLDELVPVIRGMDVSAK